MSTQTITKTEYNKLLIMYEEMNKKIDFIVERFSDNWDDRLNDYCDYCDNDNMKIKEEKIKEWEETSKRIDKGEGVIVLNNDEEVDNFFKSLWLIWF